MKKYYLTLKYKVLLGINYLGLLLLFIAFAYMQLGSINAIIREMFLFLILIIPSFIFILGTFRNEQLIITRDGVEYHTLVYAIKVSWKQVEKIKNHYQLMIRRNALVVNYSKEDILWKKLPFSLPSRFIPISPFLNYWRDSELGQQIKQYAPHLFE